jgi:O-antigen/teichoic acid export membrane protein
MNFIKKTVFSPSVLVFMDQAVFSGTNFLLMLFLAKKLELQSFGLFSTLVLITYLGMSVTNALIIQPFQVSHLKVTKKKEYFIFLFLGLIAFVLFFNFVIKLLFSFLPALKGYRLYSNAVVYFVSGLLIQDFFRKFFLGLTQIMHVLLIDVFFSTLIVILFYFFKDEIQLTNTLWILGIANLASCISGLFFIFKNYENPLSWKKFLQNHLEQGKWLFYSAFLQWSSSNFFVLVSGIYLGIEALGALRLVQSVFGVLNVGLISIENYILPKVVFLYNESPAIAKKYLAKFSLIGILFSGILLVFIFIFSNEIIILAGGIKYQQYGYVVKIMVILYFVIFLNYPTRIAIKVIVLNKIFFYGYVISFVFSVTSFHFLLNYFGLSGAVFGLVINQFVMFLYWQNQLKINQFQLWK